MTAVDLDTLPKVLCRDRRARTEPAVSICLHVPVSSEMPGTALAVARYLQNPMRVDPKDGILKPVRAGIHFTTDPASPILCADPRVETVPHCYRPSGWSVGIEVSGTIQTAEEWADDFSEATIRQTARLCATLIGLGIGAARRLTVDDVINRRAGVFDHYQATLACRAMGWPEDGHNDVGPEFPWDHFFKLLDAELHPVEDDAMAITFPVGSVNQTGSRRGRYPKIIPELDDHKLTGVEGAHFDWPQGVTEFLGLSILDVDKALPTLTVDWPCRVAQASDTNGRPVIVVTDSSYADFAFPVKVTVPD